MKILLAEDDYNSSKYLISILEKYGDCDIAVDGQEAVDMYKYAAEDGLAYDFLLIDLIMPKIQGYIVTEEIRKFEEKNELAPSFVTLMTVLTEPDKDLDSHPLFNAFLMKPVQLEQLESILNEIVNN
ncbi:MAG: response regulator [Lachnospiraceae bacterium]|nr:response regulator [Lachnospiraceae bacterium]